MLKRIDKYASRFYYDTERSRYYISATSFCSKVLNQEELNRWQATLGLREARAYARERAHYGTLMHECIDRFLIQGITWPIVYDMVDFVIERENYFHLRRQWNEDIKSDLLAFQQFAFEKNVIPEYTELMVSYDIDEEYGIAGTIDFIGQMDFYGKPRNVIMDWKSGRDGFYDSHALQLHLYNTAYNQHTNGRWEESAPLVFNWSPKSWRGNKPTYSLKNQSSHPIAQALPHLIEYAKTQDFFTLNHREVKPLGDDLILGEEPTFEILDIHKSLNQLA